MNAARAFDRIAPEYDRLFTESTIGAAQKRAVWRTVENTFQPGERILELNCGTGADALYLAARNVAVTACDASSGMIALARQRQSRELVGGRLDFHVLPTERIGVLRDRAPFDGAFSNFGGLNCVKDLDAVASDLRALVRPGGHVLLCLLSRYCLAEFLWYVLHGDRKRATRRWSGFSEANVAGERIPVWYPTAGQLVKAFSPGFRCRHVRAVGLLVPPSYLEPMAMRFPRLLRICEFADSMLSALPILRNIGDHLLIEFVRTPE